MENLFPFQSSKITDMISNLFFSLDLSRTSLKAVIQDLDEVLSSSFSLFTSWLSPGADQSWWDKAIVEAGSSLNTWLPTMSDKLYPLIIIKQSKHPTWLPTIRSLLLSPTTAPRRPRLPLRPLEVKGGENLRPLVVKGGEDHRPLVVEGGEDKGLAEGGGP